VTGATGVEGVTAGCLPRLPPSDGCNLRASRGGSMFAPVATE